MLLMMNNNSHITSFINNVPFPVLYILIFLEDLHFTEHSLLNQIVKFAVHGHVCMCAALYQATIMMTALGQKAGLG